jgi:hypothetical protein
MSNVTLDCATCGVEFCLTQGLYRRRKNDGADFYCPNGHSNVFRPTADQTRIAELEQKLTRAQARNDRLSDDWHELYAQREELIGELKECPGRCGWRSRKLIPRDPVAMGRGIERVRTDVAQHLIEEHGARAQPIKQLEVRTRDAA